MTRVFGVLRSVRPWQWLVLLVAFAGAAAGTYGGYQLATDSEAGGLAEDQQLIPVQRNDLVNSISINGSLVFPNTESVRFETQGTLGELAVAEGQVVTAGQQLAVLDEASVASLGADLAQARVDVSKAEEALTDLMAPHTPLEFAEAEFKIAEAKTALFDKREALEELLHPTAQQIAVAESDVAKARLDLDSAQESLDSLAGAPAQEDVVALIFQIETAQVALDNARRDHSLTLEDWNDKTAIAEDDIDSLAEEYRELFNAWLGIAPETVDDATDPDGLLAQWDIDLEALFDGSVVDIQLLLDPPEDDPATVWNEHTIYALTTLSPYDVQPTCEEAPLAEDQVFCVSHELSESWDDLDASRAALNTTNIQAATAISKAQDAIAKAEDSLSDATGKLADLLMSPDPLALRGKEQEITRTGLALAQAEADLAELQERAVLGEALANSNGAIRVSGGVAPALPSGEVSESLVMKAMGLQDEAAVALVRVEDAEESLEAMGDGPDPLLVALRRVELANAVLQVETVLERIEATTLTSPIHGLVTQIDIEEGDNVTLGTPIMTLVDTTVIEIDGTVDEIDVLFLQIGAPANVTMDALPGQALLGTVSYIAPDADNQQGVVTYGVRIRVEAPQGIELRSGLTAVAQLVLRSEPNVLLVPLQALRGSFDRPTVLVSENGALVERPIATGSSDDFWVVVEEGLSEGDLIVMEGIGSGSEFGFGGFGGIPVGGFGGGGFRPPRQGLR